MSALRRRHLLLAAACAPAGVFAQTPAMPPEVGSEISGAKLLGKGSLRFLGMRIYDAQLWVGTKPIAADWAAAPFALALNYGRELKGEDIAERSLTEMKRQGEISAEMATRWLATMKQLFPNVKAGDRITGVNVPGAGARFFYNGALRGESADGDFARMFFGIWLSPKTSEPGLRDSLLGHGTS